MRYTVDERKPTGGERIRIGIYGGSFDPPHEGHLRAARTALRLGGLDRVIWVPAPDIPCDGRITAPAAQRLEMVRALAGEEAGFQVFEDEALAGRRVPTVETMRRFRRDFPEDELFFLIGADKLKSLPGWTGAEELFRLCAFLCLPRVGLDLEALAAAARQAGADIRLLAMEESPFSSHEIQRRLARFEDPEGLPVRVAARIAESGLYHSPEMEQKVAAMETEKRFRHTLGVREEAVRLAALHGIPLQRTALAALLHDCAKCLPFSQMTEIARAGGVREEGLYDNANMLHGPAAAVLARDKFGVTDGDVLNAIAFHTMGRAEMSPMEQCVFVADAAEKNREPYPGLNALRLTARSSLPEAVYLSLLLTRQHLKLTGKTFHPLSNRTLRWLEDTLAPAQLTRVQAEALAAALEDQRAFAKRQKGNT